MSGPPARKPGCLRPKPEQPDSPDDSYTDDTTLRPLIIYTIGIFLAFSRGEPGKADQTNDILRRSPKSREW